MLRGVPAVVVLTRKVDEVNEKTVAGSDDTPPEDTGLRLDPDRHRRLDLDLLVLAPEVRAGDVDRVRIEQQIPIADEEVEVASGFILRRDRQRPVADVVRIGQNGILFP